MAKFLMQVFSTSTPFLLILLFLSLVGIVWGAEWKQIERACLCKEFRCNDGTFCLHAERVCNGFKDSYYIKSGMANAMYHPYVYSMEWSIWNCPGGEDESNVRGIGKCQRKKAVCSADEFKCKFGDCIKLTAVCDGKIDCWGAVDEATDFCTWLYSDDSNATSPAH